MKKIGFLILLAISIMACEKAEEMPTVAQSDAEAKTEIVKSEDDSENDGISKSAGDDTPQIETPGFIKTENVNKGDQ